MTHGPATSITFTVMLRDQRGVLQEIPTQDRADALMTIASMRSDRPEETIELITTEVFQ